MLQEEGEGAVGCHRVHMWCCSCMCVPVLTMHAYWTLRQNNLASKIEKFICPTFRLVSSLQIHLIDFTSTSILFILTSWKWWVLVRSLLNQAKCTKNERYLVTISTVASQKSFTSRGIWIHMYMSIWTNLICAETYNKIHESSGQA